MEKWKTQKARFPLSHRACRRIRKERREKRRINKEGGYAADILTELLVSCL